MADGALVVGLGRRLAALAVAGRGALVVGLDFEGPDRLAGQLLDRRDIFAVDRRGDGDRRAGQSGAAGPADAVDVVLGVGGHVEIEDVADRRDVEAARRDVAGDEQRQPVLAEIVERRRARALVHVAVERAGVEAVPLERALQDRDVALAVAEDDRVLEVGRLADELAEHRALVGRLAAGGDEELGDGGGGGRRPRRLDLDRIGQELVGEALDLRRHGGREEQRLAGEGEDLADALDVRDEAHVEHAVGLVDDEDLDAAEQDLAAARYGRAGGPGVAISTSTPRSSFFAWSSKETPPMRRATLSLWLRP